ncbi:hypothetical protein BZL30_3990 [Mycobacterium kansasii]|uniref:Uncharacterized protein n=1 Tax=Mycobacterium kansasii TaxID=1768 RepID=A0A1V3X8D8_MYCKA|nr:hypothetical protein BZL30_3990 [Mycobacterium kansasii]
MALMAKEQLLEGAVLAADESRQQLGVTAFPFAPKPTAGQ